MKHLFLNIKAQIAPIFFFLLFVSSATYAQKEEIQDTVQHKKEHVVLQFGYIQPLPFGNNVATEAYGISGGFGYKVWVRIYRKIWLGTELNMFGADVERKDLAGNYNDVNIVSYGPMAGYQFDFDHKFGLLLGAGVGYVKYSNHHPNYKFYDDGTAAWIVADFNYDMTNFFGLCLSGKLRRDFLKTELPGNKNYFDNNYFMLSLGIRLMI